MIRIAKTTGLPDRRGQSHLRHGDSRQGCRLPLYKVWAGVLRRIDNPHERNYARYGARGITVCERWRDYANFKADMEAGFASGLQLERINNEGNYEPRNCRWATPKEQARNRRSNFLITHEGQTRPVCEWAEILGVPWHRIYQRIKKLKWTVHDAFTKPSRPWSPGKPAP